MWPPKGLYPVPHAAYWEWCVLFCLSSQVLSGTYRHSFTQTHNSMGGKKELLSGKKEKKKKTGEIPYCLRWLYSTWHTEHWSQLVTVCTQLIIPSTTPSTNNTLTAKTLFFQLHHLGNSERKPDSASQPALTRFSTQTNFFSFFFWIWVGFFLLTLLDNLW